MPYLNVDLEYFSHRKVVRLVGLLGSLHVAVPIRLWCYVGKHHCEDGSLKGYSVQEIESIIGWKGKRGVLIDALTTVGFLDKVETADGVHYQVHGWLEHAGHLAALKKRARANAEKRWANMTKADAKTDATSMPPSIASPMLPLNLLNPPNLLSPLNPLGAGAPAPPNRKCAAHDKGENCQEYASAGSKYCPGHKAFYLEIQERMQKPVTS